MVPAAEWCVVLSHVHLKVAEEVNLVTGVEWVEGPDGPADGAVDDHLRNKKNNRTYVAVYAAS